MNRSIAWTIVGLMAFTLAGCGESKKGQEAKADAAPVNTEKPLAKTEKPPGAAAMVGIDLGSSDDAPAAKAPAAAKALAKVDSTKAAPPPPVQAGAKAAAPPVAVAKAEQADEAKSGDDDPKAERRRRRKENKSKGDAAPANAAAGQPAAAPAQPVAGQPAAGQPAAASPAAAPPVSLLGGLNFSKSDKAAPVAPPQSIAPPANSSAKAAATPGAAGSPAGIAAKGPASIPVLPVGPVKVSTPKDALTAFSFQLLGRIQMRIAQEQGPSILPTMVGGTRKPARAATANGATAAPTEAKGLNRTGAIKLGGTDDQRREQRRAQRKANRGDK